MVDDHLATALMLASQHIQTECVEELIRYGADVTLQDEYGMTALHYIGAFGDSDRDGGTIVRLLIESGCNPAIRDGFGHTATESAASPTHRRSWASKFETWVLSAVRP